MYERVLFFDKSDGGVIKIDSNALRKIYKFIQNSKESSEAGGVLLGRYIINSKDIVVDDVTVPMKNDIRRRFYFYRDKRLHQRIVTDKWIKSNGTCNYLGEWHTHPERIPVPTNIDMREWRKLLRTSIFDYECLYFLIAGTEKIVMWEGNKYTLEISKLNEL